MTGFLFDQNLPQRVSIKSSLPIEHVSSLGSQPSDTEIWDYAKAHDLVIVTKDTDFADRVQSTNPPPRVVHLVFGNKRRRDFLALLACAWPLVEHMIANHKLVVVHDGGLVTASA